MDEPLKRRRVTRSEAAEILDTTYDNVRDLERRGRLIVRATDPNGVKLFDRAEVQRLANKRRRQRQQRERKTNGELAASVFAMFKAGKSFDDIVIETELEPDEVLSLWGKYKAGFNYRPEPSTTRARSSTQTDPAESDEQRQQREHEEHMRELELELERRRRRVHGSK